MSSFHIARWDFRVEIEIDLGENATTTGSTSGP